MIPDEVHPLVRIAAALEGIEEALYALINNKLSEGMSKEMFDMLDTAQKNFAAERR